MRCHVKPTSRMLSLPILALLLCCSACGGAFLELYHSSFVEQLDPLNFDERVMQHKGVALVQFYTPWSPNCKKIAPAWIEAAEVLHAQGSTARLAMMDADAHREFSRRFKIDGYPTIVSFGAFTKELPEYSLEGEPSLHVDDILLHIKELEAVTEPEAAQRLKDIRKTKAKGSIPSKDQEDAEGTQPPPKKKVLRDADDANAPPTATKKKVSKNKKPLQRDTRPSTQEEDVRRRPVEEPTILSDRHRPPRKRRPIPDDLDRPHIPEFERPRVPSFDPIRPEAHDEDWEERRRNTPPPSPEDDARHAKMVEEHWERVRQRKEERDARRMRGESNEHDEIYHRHEKVIADARRRHDEHMAEVMKRHEDAMADIRRRVDAHRVSMDQQFGRVGGEETVLPAADEPIAAVEDDATAGS